jgi:hypothetical protein
MDEKRKSRRGETFKQTTNNSCMHHVAFKAGILLSPLSGFILYVSAKRKAGKIGYIIDR